MANIEGNDKPKPLLKWAGGKRGIVDKLIAAMPDEYGDYWEPFVGGAALFLELSPLGSHAVHLSDINDDLMNTYRIVRRSPRKLMRSLDEMAESHCEEYYYEVRAQSQLESSLARAARFIFINKTCYNGLIRYNSKGLINTPWGHKKNPVSLYDEENILACRTAFRGVELAARSYLDIAPKAGDFVYFDPPYDDTYNGYSKNGFGVEGQRSLAQFCRELDARGVKWMLSNSDTPLINELYAGFNISYISAPRAMSCKSDGRKAVREVLITNYA